MVNPHTVLPAAEDAEPSPWRRGRGLLRKNFEVPQVHSTRANTKRTNRILWCRLHVCYRPLSSSSRRTAAESSARSMSSDVTPASKPLVACLFFGIVGNSVNGADGVWAINAAGGVGAGATQPEGGCMSGEVPYDPATRVGTAPTGSNTPAGPGSATSCDQSDRIPELAADHLGDLLAALFYELGPAGERSGALPGSDPAPLPFLEGQVGRRRCRLHLPAVG